MSFAEVLGGHNDHGIKPIPTVVPTPRTFEVAGETGQRTLWVVFVIFVISSAIFSLRAWNVPVSRRLYHVVTTTITITAALSYFAMASGDAVSLSCQTVKDHHKHDIPDTHHESCRQVYWARYVDWSLTTPLLLLDLSLLAGLDGAHTIMAIIADVVMVLTGLFAAFGTSGTAQKWGWYAIGCIAYLFVVWHVGVIGGRTVQARGAKVGKLFGSLSVFTLVLWTAYPIVWGIADGARKVSVNTEIVIYAVLDVLAKVVFGTWLLIAHRNDADTNVEIGGYWANGLSGDGRIRLNEDGDGV
jgi:bacteriorhodopsin